jgi:hypothetical protein
MNLQNTTWIEKLHGGILLDKDTKEWRYPAKDDAIINFTEQDSENNYVKGVKKVVIKGQTKIMNIHGIFSPCGKKLYICTANENDCTAGGLYTMDIISDNEIHAMYYRELSEEQSKNTGNQLRGLKLSILTKSN